MHNDPVPPPLGLTEQQYWADGGPPTPEEIQRWNEEIAQSEARQDAATSQAQRLGEHDA